MDITFAKEVFGQSLGKVLYRMENLGTPLPGSILHSVGTPVDTLTFRVPTLFVL